MKSIMELNKETANRLWVKQFGKKQKAFDFAGREVARAAYNDRSSDYGWNVDHILPKSRGGKTADHNLICCSIKTNDEKADRFPSFKANGKLFEIQERQNHYEIIPKLPTTIEAPVPGVDFVNYYDAAQGLKCWKKCTTVSRKVAVDYAKIRIEIRNYNDLIINQFGNFLRQLFSTYAIFGPCNITNNLVMFTVVNFDVNTPDKENTQNLFDNCKILNSYIDYFEKTTDIAKIQIACVSKTYTNQRTMTNNVFNDVVNSNPKYFNEDFYLAFDEYIAQHTDAKLSGDNKRMNNGLYRYDRIFTQLSKDLSKRIQN